MYLLSKINKTLLKNNKIKEAEAKSSRGVQGEDNGLCLIAAMNLALPTQDLTSSSHRLSRGGVRGHRAGF